MEYATLIFLVVSNILLYSIAVSLGIIAETLADKED